MKILDKIYVIVRFTTHTAGHGDSCSSAELAMQGIYDSEPPHPAFLSEKAAREYLKTIPYSYDLRPYPISILN